MKKFYLGITALLITGSMFSQSQRLELYEEFTGENCNPCATINPILNAVIHKNSSKVVSIKYQCPIPSSAGPNSLYGQNSVEEGVRQTYYSVASAPMGRFEGAVSPGGTGSGSPQYFSQSHINTRYSVTSPFTMNLTHSYTANEDSLNIKCIIQASQAFTANGALKLRIALEEKEIHFATAPGSNGEKNFHDVMRKMVPDANGTTLVSSWINTQADTFDFKIVIPSYIYDLNEIALVGFIQDDGNKNVIQAAYSAPILLKCDADLTIDNDHFCSISTLPQVTLKNLGSAILSSAMIHFSIDNSSYDSTQWTGILASGQSINISLTSSSFPNATMSHTLTVYYTGLTAVIGADHNSINDQLTKHYFTSTTNYTTDFETTTSASELPPGWTLNNVDAPLWGWLGTTSAGGFGLSSKAARIYYVSYESWFANDPSMYLGTVDELYPPMFDMSALSGNQFLNFDLAYAQMTSTSNDTLEIYVSDDCGATWSNALFAKSGSSLKTKSALVPHNTVFTPTSTEWRKESVNLSSYAGQGSVLVKFKAINNGGNDMYIDNVTIGTVATGITEQTSNNGLSVYPNPFSDKTSLTFNLERNENVTVNIYNAIGELMYSINRGQMNQGINKIELNNEGLSNGIYFVTLNAGDLSLTRKVSVSR